MLFRNVQQGLRSLALHKLRTLLSALGVLFGVVAVIAMLSIGEGAKMETLSQIEQLGMNTITIKQNVLAEEQLIKALEQRSKGLSLDDMKQFQNHVPYLQHLSAFKVVETSVQSTHTSITPEILAVFHGFDQIKGLIMAEGRFICALDVSQKNRICVLGHEVAKTLGKDGHVGQTIRIDNVQFQIVGVLKNRNWKSGKASALNTRNLNQSIFLPLGVEINLPSVKYNPLNQALSEILLQISQANKITTSSAVVKRILEKNHEKVEDYQLIIPQELIQQAYRTQYTFNIVLGSIAAISLIVGGIGIMNIMLATVSERTHEIGIRRALGANKVHIAFQFLTESFLLTFIGALLGVFLGVGISVLISHFAGWSTIVTYWSVLLSVGMASGVGVCSGLYPALKAAYMDPITALRHD